MNPSFGKWPTRHAGRGHCVTMWWFKSTQPINKTYHGLPKKMPSLRPHRKRNYGTPPCNGRDGVQQTKTNLLDLLLDHPQQFVWGGGGDQLHFLRGTNQYNHAIRFNREGFGTGLAETS